MNTQLTTVLPGQIVKTIIPLQDERPDKVYVVTDDLTDTAVAIVALSQLQRNLRSPDLAKREQVPITNLTVIGKNLEEYIASFNK
ncbi:hypothetical protein EOD41_04685 [Mucilaginibacter limnophilus]|uniref:Uncharacterized protein n=1 Tax=Mucilaginibacter limnophilus TaxID=1932778 RepID=A0A437MUF5_9SPHI|nr:hypothetical protein [Mucilaginibacter limnophilus]RVU01267.1 hypothetical protein EOD41_04685 [Mucilaginibacter limnophilus]